MTKRTRRNHGGVFKAKVALEAVKGARSCRISTAFSDPSQSDHDVEEAAFGQGVFEISLPFQEIVGT